MWKALKKVACVLGPGVITGAADDDPSGIATYSQTGAQFGYGLLWTALFMLPFQIGVQEACARIGAVTGKGIASVVREHYSKPILYVVVLLVGTLDQLIMKELIGSRNRLIPNCIRRGSGLSLPWWSLSIGYQGRDKPLPLQ